MHTSRDLRSAIKRSPMLRAAVPFILGLTVARYVLLPLWCVWALGSAALLVWIFLAWRKQLFQRRWSSGVMLLPLFLILGLFWQRLHTVVARADHVQVLAPLATGWEVEVTELASVNDRTIRAWAEVRAGMVAGGAVPTSGRMLLTLLRDTMRKSPVVGDRLLIAARATSITQIPDPGGFDLRAWAASHGATHQCFAPGNRWRRIGSNVQRIALFDHARGRIEEWLHASALPDRERALVKAVLIGVRDELQKDQSMAFVRSGTIHVLAVSGSHVGIIYVAIAWALAFLGKRRSGRLLRGFLALTVIWLYAGLTGFTPSVLRATVMFSFFTIAEMTSWRVEPLNSLASAALLLLLWDPSMIVQLGFQLSFLAVLGISLFYRSLMQAWMPPNKVVHFFWSLLAVSLSAQAFTIPLCLYMFHAFPVWFLPANMVIVGLVGISVYGGISLLIFRTVPVLGAFLTVALKWLLLLLGWTSAFFAELPGAYPAVRIGGWGALGLYVLLFLASAWIFERWRWARMATMATICMLLTGWAWTAHQRNAQQQVVIYSGRDVMACAFVEGRTMHVFADGLDKWTLRSVEDHVRQSGVVRTILVDSMPRWVRMGDRKIAFMPLKRLREGDGRAVDDDLIVLYGNGWLDMDRVERMEADPHMEWLLGPGLRRQQRRLIRSWSSKKHLALMDVSEQGAYVR